MGRLEKKLRVAEGGGGGSDHSIDEKALRALDSTARPPTRHRSFEVHFRLGSSDQKCTQ
jgi:hypothetical protein